MKIANNDTAKRYNELQHAVDWSRDDNIEQQINILEIMAQLLIQAKSYTPIFENGCTLSDGRPIVQTAGERADYIINRLARTKRRLSQ